MGTGSFPGLKCGHGVLRTTHSLLVPQSWKSSAILHPFRGCSQKVQVDITQFQLTAWFTKNNVKNNTIMKHLTYKIIPINSGCLRGNKNNIFLSLNNTWMDYQQHKCITLGARMDGTLWPRPSIGRNRILQPVLKVILTMLTAQTTKPECLTQDQFQAPGRAEQRRGRCGKWFTRRKSIMSFVGSFASR
jgi:hypothetical protein